MLFDPLSYRRQHLCLDAAGWNRMEFVAFQVGSLQEDDLLLHCVKQEIKDEVRDEKLLVVVVNIIVLTDWVCDWEWDGKDVIIATHEF